MKAEAPQSPLRRPLPGHGIHRGRLRQRGVKGGIESRHLRHGREASASRIDAGYRGWIVQWRKLRQLQDLVAHAVVDEYCFAEPRAAVHHAVAHRVDFRDPPEGCLELSIVPPDVAAFPGRVPLILDCFSLSIQNHPFETAGSSIQNKYGSPRHLRGE